MDIGGASQEPHQAEEVGEESSAAQHTHSEAVLSHDHMDRRRSQWPSGDSSPAGDESAPMMAREQPRYWAISPTLERSQEAREEHDAITRNGAACCSADGAQQPPPPQQGDDHRTKQRQDDDVPEADTAPAAAPHSWWKRMREKYGSVELENKGSVARDHLALERTFLAWLRTSLSFASIGIAVTQLFRLNTTIAASDPAALASPRGRLQAVGKPLGATFIAVALLVLFLGFHRYFESQHYVIRGKFPASRGSVILLAGIAGCLIGASLAVVLAVGAATFER